MAQVTERLAVRMSSGPARPGILFIFLLFITVRAFAGGVTLAWDPVTDPAVSGYMVHYGPTAGNYTAKVDAGNNTSYAVTNLTEGATYHLAVTAYDASRVESGFSNGVSTVVPYSTPVVNFSASTTSGPAPLAMNFVNASTGNISSYAWTFGDGGTSAVKSPAHIYSASGVYTVTLEVTGPGGANTQAKNNYVTVTSTSVPPVVPPPVPPVVPPPPSARQGYLDLVDCAGIHGWAWNGVNDDPVSVDIYSDGVRIATAVADRWRSDLALAGKGNGVHGLYLPTPAEVQDGKAHIISTRYAGTTVNLIYSPQTLTCAAPVPVPPVVPPPVPPPVVGACPCSLWGNGAVPKLAADPDTSAVELGVKFKSDRNGMITGIRYYKSAQNTGTHVGSLWTSGGQLLARATFTNETAEGWQQVNFAAPVPITAGDVYVASYHTKVGRYANDDNYFATAGVDNGPLHALRDGVSGSNGVYKYRATPGFPNSSYRSTNYWVDVIFK